MKDVERARVPKPHKLYLLFITVLKYLISYIYLCLHSINSSPSNKKLLVFALVDDVTKGSVGERPFLLKLCKLDRRLNQRKTDLSVH